MKWIKENGQEIETNDLEATIKHCKSIGWAPADKEKKKAGRPKKVTTE